jgi:aryl-alcohol dehydrogenase-like predicted oxidoreductase
MHISTKGGYPTADAPDVIRISESEIKYDLKKSLAAIGVETIDFYWLHRDDEKIPAGEIIEMMNALVKEGKIKAFGASNWTTARIAKAQEYAKEHNIRSFSASQIRFNPAYNVTEREGLVGMDKKEFAYYKENSMPVVAYSSQAKGFFSKLATQGDSGLSEKAKLRYMCDLNIKKAEVIKELACKHCCSVAAIICGAFCSFKQPEVFPVIGGRNLAQIADSLTGADIVITENELKKVFETVIY